MSALFNFQSLLLVILLLICTCAYVHQIFPTMLDRNKQGFMGIFWKAARVGERLSLHVRRQLELSPLPLWDSSMYCFVFRAAHLLLGRGGLASIFHGRLIHGLVRHDVFGEQRPHAPQLERRGGFECGIRASSQASFLPLVMSFSVAEGDNQT
ncbi:hypothetical protein F4778DRAFT_191630 [Xylariomycetidae sp. FL2044]|nr:hypothetical protein F4778DRAFT_191630 [Xylariomycetidae sp. FL2044]